MEKPRLGPSTVSARRSGQGMGLWGPECRTERFSLGNLLEERVMESAREDPGWAKALRRFFAEKE